ncbi:MAG TPA: hypothetical protein VMS77_09260 [Conexivisphaerales archaeon]|nr:hypothetical protein [Conexivisphaerales archaeon]
MSAASSPLPVRGIALALVLGVVLASAAVGGMASFTGPGARSGSSTTLVNYNSTTTSGAGYIPSVQPGASSNNASFSTNTSNSTALNSGSNSVAIGDISSALSGPPANKAQNSSSSNAPAQSGNETSMSYDAERTAVSTVAWRDVTLFGLAGVVALLAFILIRRRA